MIVAIDAGNTRTKWAVLDASGKVVSQGMAENAQLDQLEGTTWHGCRRAVLSNVAGVAVAEKIAHLCQRLGLPLLTIQSTHAACGVTNRYAEPAQLGTDRWAALIAAWHLYRQPCIVATAGTALTVDALSSKGEFCGGLIVPGSRMMRHSMVDGAADLSAQSGQLDAFPVNTGDAMYSGTLFAMAGAVERMRHALQEKEGRAPRCIVSGGDAAMLLAALPSPAKIADNLVLHGLWLIEREHA
jgi:type III pantothenate kinase